MDPNEILRHIRELSQQAAEGIDVHRSERMIRWNFKELDNWLSNGGFLPAEWYGCKTISNQMAHDSST